MISLIVGENSFENERIVMRIIADFDGTAERVDGETLEVKQLPDLLMGMSLFASKRLVIIKNMAVNKALWNDFEAWLSRVSDDVHLVLVDAKPDKRTKTYKLLQKVATVHESQVWSERDTGKAETWVVQEAGALGSSLDKKSAHALVAWVGVDQWALWQALQKLQFLDTITPELIREIIEPNETENAFRLFEAALKGNAQEVKEMLRVLQKQEDPYRLFGLVSGQSFQLLALAFGEVPDAVVASDLGVHPFVISKLSQPAKRLSSRGGKEILAHFAEADADMKTSVAEPWLLLERALLKVAKTAQ
ncbi:MAG TPA: DNA polymerase III subunit delta [Candidatus Saccharimonadales bacterium]|nr:DNA polymerase III subunit delta [Candidatus Saccharimonadales bacterium]